MASISNSYLETKTVLCLTSFKISVISLIIFNSTQLKSLNPLSVIFFINSLIIQALYLVVAFKDPGFWPIQEQVQKPESTFMILVEERQAVDQENIPTIKDDFNPSEQKNNPSVQSKILSKSESNSRYCATCKMSQPLRTKHCRDCKRCVSLYDHHCPWVGNCIGQNNRIYFFYYILFQCFELWLGLYFDFNSFSSNDSVFGWAFSNGLSLLGLAIVLLFLVMVNFLLIFHMFLALRNLTTWEFLSWDKIEYFKGIQKRKSPFSRGVFFNVKEYCCERFPPFKQWEILKK